MGELLLAISVLLVALSIIMLIGVIKVWRSRKPTVIGGSVPTTTIPEGITVTPDGRSTSSPEHIRSVVEKDAGAWSGFPSWPPPLREYLRTYTEDEPPELEHETICFPRDPDHTPYVFLYCQINPMGDATLFCRNATNTGGERVCNVRIFPYCIQYSLQEIKDGIWGIWYGNSVVAPEGKALFPTSKELSDALLLPERPDIVIYLEYYNWHGDKFRRRVTFPVLKREGNKSSGGSDRVFLGDHRDPVMEVVTKK